VLAEINSWEDLKKVTPDKAKSMKEGLLVITQSGHLVHSGQVINIKIA